jgi:hypothetical protein
VKAQTGREAGRNNQNMSFSSPAFKLIAKDQYGNELDTSRYDPKNLKEAAELSCQLAKQEGVVVIIKDTNGNSYFADEFGNATLIP